MWFLVFLSLYIWVSENIILLLENLKSNLIDCRFQFITFTKMVNSSDYQSKSWKNCLWIVKKGWIYLWLQDWSVFIQIQILIQALSGDFQHSYGKMHAQILLGVRWCVMPMFLFLKLYNFNKGIICIYSIFKKPKTSVFKCHLLTF